MYYRHTNGFISRYENSDNIETVSNPNAVKKSVIEDGSGISRACNGVYMKIKGRYFKFYTF